METKKDKYENQATKISPSMTIVWDAICQSLGTDTYHILQRFMEMMIRAANIHHDMTPEIQKIMTLMESDAGWQNAFSLCNPEGLKVSQCILILEQKDKKGFGMVMVDRPFMETATQTECVDDILERVTEVGMYGIYRRLRWLGAKMGCNNLSDILLTMIDAQSVVELDEENRREMQGSSMYDDRGREIAYGKRTKTYQHRTPDGEANRQQRLMFEDFDRETGKDFPDSESDGGESTSDKDSGEDIEKDFRPHGSEW